MRTTRFHSTPASRMALLSSDGTEVDMNGGLDIEQQHGDGADAALLDMQGANAEVQANDSAIAELENTNMALESLLESAEASVETGGLDPLSAEILTKAVNNETAPLGTPADEIVPALESYKSSTDRREATKMAVEGIKDWIEKVWAKIKEYIQKGRDLAKKLYVKVKQAIQGLQRRVKGLKEDLDKRDEKAVKPGQVELADNTWVTTSAEAGALASAMGSIFGEYTTKAIGHAEAVATALGANDAAKAAAEGGTEEEKKAKEEKKEFVVPKALDNITHKIANDKKLLPGRRRFVGEAIGFSIQEVTDASSAVKKYTSKPLAHSELSAILGHLETLAKEVTDFERNFEAKDRAEEKVLAAGDKFSKAAKAESAKGSEADVRAAVNNAKEAALLLDKPIKSALSYSATAINGVCSFVAAHVKMYDKK